MIRVLITGGNGFLGQHLCHFLSKYPQFNIIAVSKSERRIPSYIKCSFIQTDLTDATASAALLQTVLPNIIVHTAAMSQPNECHNNPMECLRQNTFTVRQLLTQLEALPITHKQFIFISTDFIFGEGGPHNENDVPNPLNLYGQSKLLAEHFVEAAPIATAIIRPVFMYGPIWQGLRNSFVQWVASQLQQHQPIKVVTDQLRTPTYVNDVCWAIHQIIIKEHTGVYHTAGGEIVSPYDIAVATANVLQLDVSKIIPVTGSEFPEVVLRPKKSGLHIQKTINTLGYHPTPLKQGILNTFKAS
ncbi:MAG: SDR family oxidoreductase [Chitinophagaceae bacterium]